MTKILYLDYISLTIYVLMLVAFLMRTRKTSKRRGVFSLVLAVGMFATIYDVCAVLLDNRGEGATVLKYVLHCGYLILRNLITPFLGAYLIAVTDTWHFIRNKKSLRIAVWVPFATVALLTLSSPYTHLIFYLDSADAYTRGPLFFVLYISALFYTCFCIYYAFKYYDVLTLSKFLPLLSIVPGQVIAVIIQLLYPNILCEMITTSLCLLIVMITIEKPEERIDFSTGLYKSEAFYELIIQAIKVDKPLSIVLINTTNHSAITSYVSFSGITKLYQIIARRLEAVSVSLGITPEIYNLENGLFAAVLSEKDIPFAPRAASHISEAMKEDCVLNSFSVAALTNLCVIKMPNDINDIEEIRFIIRDFRKAKYSGEVLMGSSLVKSKDYAIMANIDSILKHAIEKDEFEVYYQPIYSFDGNHFNSAEALIRLFTKEYGFIRPDLFIPLAEESGLIHEIGMIVLRKVCEFISSDEYKELGLDYIEVNLSTVQCMDADLPNRISSVLNEYGVDPSQINLEVTETSSAFVQRNMIQNIETLHDSGFSFSLDDFGTGYSNMVRISSLPLSIVKLDRSFTRTEENDDLKIILRNTIRMIKKMNMKIVVEGVETEEMLNTFRQYECEYIQGYYFSKPLPRFDFIEYIRKSMAVEG